jgi:hypothetical protein
MRSPESNAYEKIEKTSFKLTVEPEMYLLALIENPNKLEPDVLPAVRRLMYQAYRQGKQLNKGENE